jgi:hypothetical protein
MSHRVDDQQECAFITLSGDVTEWEVGMGLQELWAEPRYELRFSRLVDATEIRSASLPPLFLTAVAGDFSQQNAGKVALIAGSDSVYAVFTMYREQLEGVCRVFRDKREPLG